MFSLSITTEDIKKADTILRLWLSNAKARKNQKAISDVKHLKKVLDSLTGNH
jgi:hypothetical protein